MSSFNNPLYNKARDLSNARESMSKNARICTRLAADFMDDATSALRQGNLDRYLICLKIAGDYAKEAITDHHDA